MYEEKYPVGTKVRIASRDQLEGFKRQWGYRHELEDAQLQFAGMTDTVKAVGFYYGGDVLYNLTNAPGTWHEAVLEPA